MLSIREVKAFQAANFDWTGTKLVVDGDFGPKSRWSYAVEHLDSGRRQAIRRACGEVGTAEKLGNRGAKVDDWNQRCGVPLGSPWCASSASWFISVGSLDIRIAGAMRLGSHFPVIRNTQLALAGDLSFFDTDGDAGDKGHIGLIVSDEEEGEFAVVEGNHANKVAIVRRRRSEVLVSRPFNNSRAVVVPMPRHPDGSHCLPLVHVSIVGTR